MDGKESTQKGKSHIWINKNEVKGKCRFGLVALQGQ